MWIQRLLCPQSLASTTSSWIKLLHSKGGLCSEITEHRTTAGRGDCRPCLHNIDAWCSHTVQVNGQCFPGGKNSLHEDADNIIITNLLLLLTYNMIQIVTLPRSWVDNKAEMLSLTMSTAETCRAFLRNWKSNNALFDLFPSTKEF